MFDNLALSDNGFLFDTRTGSTYSLSSTGTLLLRSLIAGAAPDGLPAVLVDEFELDGRTAAQDVEQFLLRLRDLRLVASDTPPTEAV